MRFLDADSYDDYYDYEKEECERKIQRLINAGICPDRIRPDGTFVMTKEEFITTAVRDIEKKKQKKAEASKKVFTSREELFMNYVFKKRKSKRKY